MTVVTIRDEKGSVSIDMVGHANHPGGGGDVVCAACSVLIQAMVNAVIVTGVPVSWRQGDGEVHAEFAAGRTLHRDLRARGALDMLRVGLEMLAQSYPQNVRFAQ